MATLGFALARAGVFEDAFNAAQHATMIDPDNWRQWVRLALWIQDP